MRNRYLDIIQENEKPYEGKIIDILNDTKIKLSEAKDIYSAEKVAKYEKKIIEEAMKSVREVQQSYLNSTSDLLDKKQAEIMTALQQKPQLTNTEILLQEMKKSNELKINELKIKAMSDEDIIQSCNFNSNELYVLQAKQELNLRAASLGDDPRATQLKDTARSLKHYTEEDEKNIALQEFKSMIANPNLMPGVPFGTKLAILDGGGIEDFLLKDTQLQADRIAQATD